MKNPPIQIAHLPSVQILRCCQLRAGQRIPPSSDSCRTISPPHPAGFGGMWVCRGDGAALPCQELDSSPQIPVKAFTGCAHHSDSLHNQAAQHELLTAVTAASTTGQVFLWENPPALETGIYSLMNTRLQVFMWIQNRGSEQGCARTLISSSDFFLRFCRFFQSFSRLQQRITH